MPPDLLTTQEAADWLRIKERKLYALVRDSAVPCSKVGGKWVFPRRLLEAWVLRQAEGGAGLDLGAPRPLVIAGSHDPLLEWAVRESGSDLALLVDGSLPGLARLADGRALACGLHVPEPSAPEADPATWQWNAATAAATLAGPGWVLVEWAWRDQGLMLPPGNPKGIAGVADLSGLRLVGRQDGAGSRLLFDRLAVAAGLHPATVAPTDPPARSESDVALAVATGMADAGFGIGSVARTFRLDFTPLARERYDLAIGHRDYFDPPWQRLMALTRTAGFAAQATRLGAYDVTGTGSVHWNAGAAKPSAAGVN